MSELVNLGSINGISNEKVTVTAMKHFKSFLGHLNVLDNVAYSHTIYSPEIIPHTFYTRDVFGKFANFLMTVSKIKKYHTCISYISKVKSKLEQDYENVTLPFMSNATFYTSLRLKITREYMKNCVASGEVLVDSAPAMTKEDQSIICKLLLGRNTPSSNEERCLICHQFQIFGRINEPALAKKADYRYVSQENRTALIYSLRRTKNASVQELTMICHYDSYESCPFHSLATLISVNCDTSERLYPLIMASNSPANYVNRMLLSIYEEWEDGQEFNDGSSSSSSSSSTSSSSSRRRGFLTAGLTSHSGRRGAAQEVDLHKDIPISTLVDRGGWSVDAIHRVFTYVTKNSKGDTMCARAVSSWPDATAGGMLPSIDCIGAAEDQELFRFFSLSLMSSATLAIDEATRVSLTISLLRFHDKFASDYPNHDLVSRIEDCRNVRGVSISKFELWVSNIVRAFTELNVMYVNMDSMGEDTRVPVTQISDFMDKSSIVFRMVPGLVSALSAISNQLEELKRQNNLILNQNHMSPLGQVAVTPTQFTATPTPITPTDLTVGGIITKYNAQHNLKECSLSSVFLAWFTQGLHNCRPIKGSAERWRLNEFAVFVFYAKRFLLPNTVLDPKNDVNADYSTELVWQTKMSSLAARIEKEILLFLVAKREVWRTNTDNNNQRARSIEATYCGCIKKMKRIHINLYPCPENVTDLVTSDSIYFLKELPPEREKVTRRSGNPQTTQASQQVSLTSSGSLSIQPCTQQVPPPPPIPSSHTEAIQVMPLALTASVSNQQTSNKKGRAPRAKKVSVTATSSLPVTIQASHSPAISLSHHRATQQVSFAPQTSLSIRQWTQQVPPPPPIPSSQTQAIHVMPLVPTESISLPQQLPISITASPSLRQATNKNVRKPRAENIAPSKRKKS